MWTSPSKYHYITVSVSVAQGISLMRWEDYKRQNIRESAMKWSILEMAAQT